MNRERDPVGVDPLMHPPVALTLIHFSVKIAHGLCMDYHEKKSKKANSQRKRGCYISLQAAKAALTPDCSLAGMLMQC